MAYIRKKVSSYKWKVTIESPSEDGSNTFELQEFTCTFKKISTSLIKKLSNKGDADLLDAVLVGWDGIEEEDGTAITCTTSNKKEFIDDPYWARGVVKGYLESLEGAGSKN